MTDRLRIRDYLAWGYFLSIVTFIVAIQIAPFVIHASLESAHATRNLSELMGNQAMPAAQTRNGKEANRDAHVILDDGAMASMPITSGTTFIPLDSMFLWSDTDADALANATDGSVTVRKVVRAQSKELGTVAITIDRDSRLLMDINDARKLLSGDQQAQRVLSLMPVSGLASFATMREKGIDFRYDPNLDAFTVSVK